MDNVIKEKIDEIEKILIMPYSHTDFAWTNTRDWHICRYIKAMNEVLDIMKVNKEFTWIIDNIIHFLKVYNENCPERMDEFKSFVQTGRIYIGNGGYSLARPTQIGSETYLRNMQAGREEFEKIFGQSAVGKMFYNADTACGHSQMPQILKLGGYDYYRFFRCEKSLDFKRIPKQFIWSGLDDSKIIVSRGNYGGFMFCNYMDLDYDENWDAIKVAFYNEDLSERMNLLPTKTIMLNHGCDDFLPLHNLFDKPIDLTKFMKEWNAREKSIMKFSTPDEYFEDIALQDLKEVSGVLDQCDLSYNAPKKGNESFWHMRYALNDLIVEYEKLSCIAHQYGVLYDEKEIKNLWLSLFEITGHAIEFILKDDEEKLYNGALECFYHVKELIIKKTKQLSFKVGFKGDCEYLVINTSDVKSKQVLRIHITSANGVGEFEVYNSKMQKMEYQICNSYCGDKAYISNNFNAMDAFTEVEVEPLSVEIISVISKEKRIEKLENTKYFITANDMERDQSPEYVIRDSLGVSFNGAKPVEIVYNGIKCEGKMFDLRFIKTNPTREWLFDFTPVAEYTFEPVEAQVFHNGPLVYKYEVKGKLGIHSAKIIYTVFKGKPTIHMDVELENMGMEGYFTADFRCINDKNMFVDIPFGVEKRDLSIEGINSKGEFVDPAGVVECCLTGQLYANSFVGFDNELPMAILSKNCSTYYRSEPDKQRISIILNANMEIEKRSDERVFVWAKQMPQRKLSSKGLQKFSFSLTIHENNNNKELFSKTEALRKPMSVTRKFGISGIYPQQPLINILDESLQISALYMENGKNIVRMFETDGISKTVKIKMNCNVEYVEKIDLQGNVMQKIEISDGEIIIKVRKYEIITLRY